MVGWGCKAVSISRVLAEDLGLQRLGLCKNFIQLALQRGPALFQFHELAQSLDALIRSAYQDSGPSYRTFSFVEVHLV
jgi:hypothetical protein